ncbi:hypothetical protein [Herbaspirillum sp. B65]|uniref:hypothetical protein n=1 Tax=Herbaspirillum sp. B65 TaxID=137708 RepID=UPI0005CA0AC6|nr:hypothetical protein [Herbaspirillum sp. B65]
MAASAAIFFCSSFDDAGVFFKDCQRSVSRLAPDAHATPKVRERHAQIISLPRSAALDDLLIWANALPGARVLIVSCRKGAILAFPAALFPVSRLPLAQANTLLKTV